MTKYRVDFIMDGINSTYTVHDYIAYVDRQFYCSRDTYQEVVQELSKDGIV